MNREVSYHIQFTYYFETDFPPLLTSTVLDFCYSKFKFPQVVQYLSCPLGAYSLTYWTRKETFFTDLQTECSSAQYYSVTVDYISFCSLK